LNNSALTNIKLNGFITHLSDKCGNLEILSMTKVVR